MALTYTLDTKGQAFGVSATITSNTISAATGDFIVAAAVFADESDATGWTVSNTGTAIVWTIGGQTTVVGSNAKVIFWTGTVGATPPTTVSVQATAGANLTAAKFLATLAHTGADTTTPLPAGNVFAGTGGHNVSQAITPTRSGSALWMIAGDWAATNTYAAAANCTLAGTDDQPGAMTSAIVRPSTQPRTDALAFTIGETDTGGTIAWVAFEVVAQLPVVTVQPTNQLAAIGATATFSITATNASTYQWQDDRTGDFTNVSGGSGATTSSYTTATTDLTFSNRRYRCVVDAAVFSNAATLFIGHPYAWTKG